jgi:uncharacterized protein with GYD domain
MLFSFTQQGIEKIKDSPPRVEAAKKIIRQAGGEVQAFYGILGSQYDTMFIQKAPNDEKSGQMALAIASVGNVRTETRRLLNVDEFGRIISGVRVEVHGGHGKGLGTVGLLLRRTQGVETMPRLPIERAHAHGRNGFSETDDGAGQELPDEAAEPPQCRNSLALTDSPRRRRINRQGHRRLALLGGAGLVLPICCTVRILIYARLPKPHELRACSRRAGRSDLGAAGTAGRLCGGAGGHASSGTRRRATPPGSREPPFGDPA